MAGSGIVTEKSCDNKKAMNKELTSTSFYIQFVKMLINLAIISWKFTGSYANWWSFLTSPRNVRICWMFNKSVWFASCYVIFPGKLNWFRIASLLGIPAIKAYAVLDWKISLFFIFARLFILLQRAKLFARYFRANKQHRLESEKNQDTESDKHSNLLKIQAHIFL